MKLKNQMTKILMNILKQNIITLITLTFLFATSPALRGESMMSSLTVIPEEPEAETRASAKPVNRTATTSKTGARTGAVTKTPPKSATKPPAKSTLDLTPTQENKLLVLLNRGTAVELTAISGIAAARAEAIVGARPFQKVHEVILVPGVGDATFNRILRHGKTLTQPPAKSSKS